MSKIFTVLMPHETRVLQIVDTDKETGNQRIRAITFEGDNTLEVTDGYHTMEELYEHRYALYLALTKIYDNYLTPIDGRGSRVKCWKSKLHSDGTMFEGEFILGMTVKEWSFEVHEETKKFDISYHLPLSYWDKANVIELPYAPPYDGYTPKDVIERLGKL